MISTENTAVVRITEICAPIAQIKTVTATEERMLDKETILKAASTNRNVINGRKNTKGV